MCLGGKIECRLNGKLYTSSHTTVPLELAKQQVSNHFTASDVGGSPKGREVQRGAQTISETKEQHGRDPAAGILKRETALGHLVLLDSATVQMVDRASRVDLRQILARRVRPLLAGQNVEVVIGCVAAGMAFRANGGTKDDEVFRYTLNVLVSGFARGTRGFSGIGEGKFQLCACRIRRKATEIST